MKRTYLLAVLGILLLVASAARVGGASSSTPTPTPPNPVAPPTPAPPRGPTGKCGYPAPGGPSPLPKTNQELWERLRDIILRENPRVRIVAARHGYPLSSPDYPTTLAKWLVRASAVFGVPLELLAAVCWRESSFNFYLGFAQIADDLMGVKECKRPWPVDPTTKKLIGGALGPMQVMPYTAYDMGYCPVNWLKLNDGEARLFTALYAGAKYLRQMRDRTGNWCDALHAYYWGFADWQSGKRNPEYVADIVGRANAWTELKV